MKLLVSFCCLLAVGLLSGQAGRIEYFTVTDGLSTREINDLHIGKDGYLWVATMDGLNRFDGHSFLNFGQGALSGTRLSRGAVESVRAANDGHLIITFNEFYGYFDRLDPRDFTVEQVRMVPSTGVIGYPRAIETDELGRTFVVTIGQDGTILYEYTDQGFKAVWAEPEDGWLTFAPRIELLPLSNGQFLLYDEEHGFRHLSAGGKLLDKFMARTAAQRKFYTMAEGPDGYVYLSFRDGYPLYRWRPDDEREPAPIPPLDDGLVYTKVFRDGLGQLLFLATEDILGQGYPDEYYLLDTAGTFTLLERDLPTDRLVSAAAALNWQQTTYLGLREGLGVMQRFVKPIQTYLTSRGDNSLYQNSVRGMTEDAAGNVYVMEASGALHVMAPGSSVLEPRLLVDKAGEPIGLREAGQLAYDRRRNVVWGVAQPPGRTKSGLLLRYDLSANTATVYNSEYPLTCLAVGPEGQLYLGASDPRKVGLLMRFDPDKVTFEELTGSQSSVEKLRGLRITYLYPSNKGTLLIGTKNRGLVGYNPVNREVTFYTDPSAVTTEEPLDINAFTVNCIYEDSIGKWWLGTDAGLQVYNAQDGSVEQYGRQDGLSSNTVVGIAPDSTGGYWLSTHNGLVHLPADPKTGPYRRYYLEDGLVNDEFNRYAFLRDHSGRYFFGGDGGMSVFRDADLSSESAGSDVMLTEVVIYGRGESRAITRNLKELKDVMVMANEKSIAVSFALPVGQRPSLTQFRVKLEGFSDAWREIRNERTVRYNNLPSGRYRLVVQAAGTNGNYGTQQLELNIKVRQYLIEKTWFQFLIAVVIVGLFFLHPAGKAAGKAAQRAAPYPTEQRYPRRGQRTARRHHPPGRIAAEQDRRRKTP